MIDLGLGADVAHAINDAGQVVGVTVSNPDADDGEYYAFYWDSTVGVIRLYDLLSSGCGWAELRYALDINNRGQIVGEGITTTEDEEGIAKGENHAFLMTPALPTIKVPMKLTPQVLNCHSKGKCVKAHLVLPDEFTLEDVYPNSLTAARPLGMELVYANIFANNEGLVEIEVALRRDDFCNALKDSWRPEEIITIRGSSTSGQYFYGMATIRIIDSMLECVSLLSSHWLEEYCGEPDWCGGFDLNRNHLIDFKDFAIMALHWLENYQP